MVMRLWRWWMDKPRDEIGPACPSCLSHLTSVSVATSPDILTYRCTVCNTQWEARFHVPLPHWGGLSD